MAASCDAAQKTTMMTMTMMTTTMMTRTLGPRASVPRVRRKCSCSPSCCVGPWDGHHFVSCSSQMGACSIPMAYVLIYFMQCPDGCMQHAWPHGHGAAGCGAAQSCRHPSVCARCHARWVCRGGACGVLGQMSTMVLACSDQAKDGAEGRGGPQGCGKGAGEVRSKEARFEKVAEGEQVFSGAWVHVRR